MQTQVYMLVIAAVVSYLLGSISFTRVIGGIFAPGEDLSKTEVDFGDHKDVFTFSLAGGTNVAFRLGARFGILTSLLDMLKVFLPTLAFRLLYPDSPYYLVAAAFGVAGHNWPLYYGFKGGAGLSSILGGLLVVDALAVIVTPLAGMILGLAVFRDIFAAGALWVFLLIPWIWLRNNSPWHLFYAVAVNIFLLIATLPTFSSYLRLKRKDPESYRKVVESSHMARGLMKIGRLFGMR